jgi:hypothetical protein
MFLPEQKNKFRESLGSVSCLYAAANERFPLAFLVQKASPRLLALGTLMSYLVEFNRQ